jgi:hypothetical protein
MRKLITLILAAVFAAGLFPVAFAVSVSDFNDVAGHWGEAHLTKLIEAGVIVGDGRGNAMPDRLITHWEAAIMLSKVFGVSYNDDVPKLGMSRLEAFTAIRNAFRIPSAARSFLSAFPDIDDVAGGAQDHILAMEAAGMIAGKNGRIAPADAVTRAEFAALLAKCAGLIIDGDTDFENAEWERAVIRRPGLTVKSLTVEYLTIAQGVGDGGVTLENCDAGSLYVFGGGKDSIRLVDSNVTGLIMDPLPSGGVRVFVDESSLVEGMTISLTGGLDGLYATIGINFKEIMSMIGFGIVSISEENPALAFFGQGGGITMKDGIWLKETEDLDWTESDGEFNVLVLSGEAAILLIVSEGRQFVITVDATGLTGNGTE